MAANPDLPEAILLEIFSRLPTKSVGRCRCLSKSWRSNLSSTNFIKKHLTTRQQTIKQQNLALITAFDQLHIVTSPLKNDEQVKMWTGVPEKWLGQLGACNGLVLLMGADEDDKDRGTFLMNPITLQQVNVPFPDPAWNDLSSRDYGSVHGFGYDCYSDDFKVIALQSSYPVERENSYVPKSVTLVDVYSVKRGVWKRLDSNIYPYGGDLVPSLTLRRNGAFVNGYLHWFIRNRKSGFYCHIAAFDLAKEVFHDIPIPAVIDRDPGPRERDILSMLSTLDNGGITIDVIGGCLSIVHNFGGADFFDPSSGGGTDVWMMKEYGVAESWVRFHIAGHYYGLSLIPLCLVGDEQLMCYTDKDALVACDLKDGTTEKLIVGGEDTWYWGGIAFVDSLISPGKCDCDNESTILVN